MLEARKKLRTVLTTLRSTNGPYIEMGRLTSDERRETKWTLAFFGMVGVNSSLLHSRECP